MSLIFKFKREKVLIVFIHFLKGFTYYVHSAYPAYMPTYQKRATHLILDACEPLCHCWTLNSGSLEKQQVPLTSEPSLQPLYFNF